MSEKQVQLREEIVKLLTEIEVLANQDQRTADDSERGERMLADLTAKETAYDQQRKLDEAAAKRAAFTEAPGKRATAQLPTDEHRGANGEFEKRDTRSIGRRFVDSDIVKDYRENPKGKSDVFNAGSLFEERALIYGGALAADMVRPQMLPGIQRPNEALGLNAIRSVLLSGQTASDSILFVKENVFTNAAATVAEAVSTSTGAKPESSLTFNQATAPVEVIAHWIPVTRQALDDVPQLQSYIEGRLIDGLVREENDQLLNGDGTSPNISGLLDQSGIQVLDQTYFTANPVQNPGVGGPENFNRILRAKTKVMTTGDSMATFIILNPADYESLLTLADTTDNYFGAGPFSTGVLPRIWGLTPVVTEDMTAGNYLIGDGTAAQVWDRWAARILIADQHADFFIRNMFVLLAEERIGLSVFRPSAFALTDLV